MMSISAELGIDEVGTAAKGSNQKLVPAIVPATIVENGELDDMATVIPFEVLELCGDTSVHVPVLAASAWVTAIPNMAETIPSVRAGRWNELLRPAALRDIVFEWSVVSDIE